MQLYYVGLSLGPYSKLDLENGTLWTYRKSGVGDIQLTH